MHQDWLGEILEIVRPYNSADLITSVAALQLLPQNAERLFRLEALARVASTLAPAEDKPKISIARLRRVCNSLPLASMSSQEDPSDQPFTEAFTFTGGSYVVFPGIVEDATFTLRHLGRALLGSEALAVKGFATTGSRTLGAVLTLIDTVAARAGLPRGVPPDPADSGVYVPHSRELKRVKSAVRVEHRELDEALRKRGLEPHTFESFAVRLGETSLDECTLTAGPLDARPLIAVNGSLIVAAPGLMLAALRHRLICLARDLGILDILALQHSEAVWETVCWSLDLLRHVPLDVVLPEGPSKQPVIEGVFSMDTDKVLYVSLCVDDLRAYDTDDVFGSWESPGLAAQIENRQRVVEKFLLQELPWVNEILVLHLMSGVGRAHTVGLGEPPPPLESPRLLMSASDLEVIALLEEGNWMLLRQYAIASNRVREHTDIFAWSQLDEFWLYCESQRSYYLSDEHRPNFMTVTPGSGLKLRLQAIAEYDLHAVPSFEPGYWMKVARIARMPDMPIYSSMELARLKLRFAVVVEGLPVYIWVVGPSYAAEPEQLELGQVYMQVADMIAYWIWQLSPALKPLLSPLERESSPIVIRLRADPGTEWWERSELASAESGAIADYEVLVDEGLIMVHLAPSLMTALESPDNQGERVIMSAILSALDELAAGSEAKRHLTAQDVQGILDQHAPLGRKKKALVLSRHDNPALSARGLPRHRSVQMASKTALLDEIAEHLVNDSGLSVGPIQSKEDRVRVLNEVVRFLYLKLQKLVSTLIPRDLLAWLLEYHEAIRYDLANLRLTMPTRQACFWADEEAPASIVYELQELYESAQAARFVIEYVVAQPPSGLRPMSWSVYDELMALATEIILWAGISDMINYDVADIGLAILRSRRLGSDLESVLGEARDRFLPLHSLEEVDLATDLFDRHWTRGRSSRVGPRPEAQDVDSAFGAEFGYTLTELSSLMTGCFALGAEQDSAVKRVAYDELVHRLSESTGYPRPMVAKMLADLTLQRRLDFLVPPAPFRKQDVYPWRFGRPLSHMRRPLLLTASNGEAVVMWGNLHLYDAINYIIDMCLSGRLQSRAGSPEMRSLLARFNREKGRAFTNSVREAFDAYPHVVTVSNLRKIGKMRIRGVDGNDLGDIDVLAINSCRRRVLVAECKSLSIARTPAEMANELNTLFVAADGRPTVVRHQRRADWIKSNLSLVLQQYGVSPKGRWQVEPIIVVDEELFTAHLFSPPMAVISLRTLRKQFIEEWA